MKPTADMLTSILHNFRVNGRFNQDQLIIGRGIDEEISLKLGDDQPGIETLTFNDITYYRRTDMDAIVYDPSIIKNVFGNTESGTPSRIIYYDAGTTTWYGSTYTEGGSSIGSSQPMYVASGGDASSPRGTVWRFLTGGSDEWPSTSDSIGGASAPSIRFTPGSAGERTFTIQGTTTDHHPVFDDKVILRPYIKPSNDFTSYYVLAEEDTIWISEEFPDPDYPGQHYVMFIGSEQSGAPHQWMIINIAQGNEDYNLNWSSVSPTYYFLGSQEGVTWSNGEASAYPESPNDFGTRGFLGVQPVLFEMSNQVGSDPKLEYTNDGTTWYPFGASGSVNIEYEPIVFTHTDLQPDGTLKIQHDFNDFFPMCLGYTPRPKDIKYLDNQLVLDYSDQNSSNLSGAVWFVGSKQSMLLVGGGRLE